MKVELVTPYRVSLLQRYGVTVRGNVTSVYPSLRQRGHQDRPNVVHVRHKPMADVLCLMQDRCSESITVTNHSDSTTDWTTDERYFDIG